MVIDASALLEILLRTDRAPFAERHARGAQSLHAPELIDLEVASVVRGAELRGAMSRTRAEEALQDLIGLGVALHRLRPLLARAWSLRASVAISDGYYAALAEALEEPLLTTDLRLARALREQSDLRVLAPE